MQGHPVETEAAKPIYRGRKNQSPLQCYCEPQANEQRQMDKALWDTWGRLRTNVESMDMSQNGFPEDENDEERRKKGGK